MNLKDNLVSLFKQRTIDSDDKSIDQQKLAEFVIELQSKTETLGSPSDVVTASSDEYMDVVRSGTELLANDFLLRSEADSSFLSTDSDTGTLLTYDVTNSATIRAIELYISFELFSPDIDPVLKRALEKYHGSALYNTNIDSEIKHAVGGYLFAEIIHNATRDELATLDDPDDVILEVIGHQGKIMSTEDPETVGGTQLYQSADTGFFIDGLIHHLQHQTHQSYLERLNERLDAFGENYRERRKLEELFGRWERYSGDMYFHQFVEQYKQQSLDPDDPTVDVIEDELFNTEIPLKGFIDGLQRGRNSDGEV